MMWSSTSRVTKTHSPRVWSPRAWGPQGRSCRLEPWHEKVASAREGAHRPPAERTKDTGLIKEVGKRKAACVPLHVDGVRTLGLRTPS
eukprot:1160829-Pelagomonas_calceolata.AAC.3